jgi:hypothetical protein
MLVEGFRTCLWNPLPPGWHEAIDEKTKKVRARNFSALYTH